MRFAILGIAAIALVACGSDEESFFQEWDVDDPEALELSSDSDDTESSGSGAQNDIIFPVIGCRKDIRQECKACLPIYSISGLYR